jgi:hypothetical protein
MTPFGSEEKRTLSADEKERRTVRSRIPASQRKEHVLRAISRVRPAKAQIDFRRDVRGD